MPTRNLSTTAYLVLRPTFTRWAPQEVDGFTVDRVLKKRPTAENAPAGSIIMALNVKMPAQAFEPLRPEVTVTVPEGAYEVVPEVQVIEPTEV